jgi:hypothetical protein
MKAYFSFETGTLHAPDGPLSQQTCAEIWNLLPITGAGWVERGLAYVQQADDGGTVFCLGPVEAGVTSLCGGGQ